MTVIEGYKLAKQDVNDYISGGHELIRGELTKGAEHCALGVLYAAADVGSRLGRLAAICMMERYDGAHFNGLVSVNDYAPHGTRLAQVLAFLDERIALCPE